MYKKETLKKLVEKANVLYNEMIYEKDLKVSISTGNRKIGRVMNVSLTPIVSCGNCKDCAGYCYDVKACLQYENVIKARVRNYVIWKQSTKDYFNQIEKRLMRRRTNKYFRWHVGGEIPTIEYFAEMVRIAKLFPGFTFWTYTKMYGIVNAYCYKYGREAIPENLHIMFSEWDGTTLYNPYNFPIFTCRLKDGNKNHTYEWFETLYKCPGNCDICKAAKRGCIVGESTFADEH